jgi:ribosomal protein S18 acetylase RimI-like enzyme
MHELNVWSLSEGVTIRRATPADLDAVLSVVHDATHRLREKGLTMWKLYLTDEGIAQVRDRVDGVDGAQVYLAESAGAPAGAFSLQWSDPEVWGDDPQSAGYLHMLSVHRRAKGMDLGRRMLQFAEERLAAMGIEYFRLDCWSKSAVLCAYYPTAGFAAVREDEKHQIILWEKRVQN